MARRGLLATLVHQAQISARNRARAEQAAVRAHNAAVRKLERAQKAAERIDAKLARAAQAERKRLEREAQDAHIEAMEAEVEEHNARLSEIYGEIDSILAETLGVDDYVDLENLRVLVAHPPFDRPDLERPIPPPDPVLDPPEPVLVVPEPPKGLARLLGKQRHARAVARAEEMHAAALEQWRRAVLDADARRKADLAAHAKAESQRQYHLERERARFARECAARELEAAQSNQALDDLIANLGYGTPEAIQEYVSIVLSNSVYPEVFKVTYDFSFDAGSSELRLRVAVPGPNAIPDIKEYKYSKSNDEITAVKLSQKACRDRYATAVQQVALRALHEVFEADRRGLVATIALEVGTEAIDPATGRHTYIPFVVAGVAREVFATLNLSAVVPARTLELLGAAVSKNPHGLVAAERSGVRRS